MKLFAALSLLIVLTGCSTKGINTTLFLREEASRLKDLKGNECLESGYQVIKDRERPSEDKYILIVYYQNCDIHRERLLNAFEPAQWGIKPKGKSGFQ